MDWSLLDSGRITKETLVNSRYRDCIQSCWFRYGYYRQIHALGLASAHLSNHPRLGWRIEQQYLLHRGYFEAESVVGRKQLRCVTMVELLRVILSVLFGNMLQPE